MRSARAHGARSRYVLPAMGLIFTASSVTLAQDATPSDGARGGSASQPEDAPVDDTRDEAPGDAIDACLKATADGQRHRDEGRLLAARDAFHTCAQDACPPPVRADCAQWLGENEAAIPTIVISARDAEGRDLLEVEVWVDGHEVLTRLNGRPLELDPGAHQLRLKDAYGHTVERRIVVAAGEKNRGLRVLMSPPPPPTPPPPEPPPPPAPFVIPTVSWVLGGLGVASLVTFGTLAGVAHSDRAELRATCAPNCASADVDAVRNKLIASNVMVGLGVASLATAGILTFALQSSAPGPSVGVSLGPFHGSLRLTY